MTKMATQLLRLLEHPLFFEDVQFAHNIVYQSVKALNERAYTFIDEALADARTVLCSPDLYILPKTPRAERKTRRIRKSSPESTKPSDNVEEQDTSRTRGNPRKRLATETFSDDDDFQDAPASKICNKESTPPTARRNTRANTRAATTSRARATQSSKPKKKAKSQEPVLKIDKEDEQEVEINDNVDGNPTNKSEEAAKTSKKSEDHNKTPTNTPVVSELSTNNSGDQEEEEVEETVEEIVTWTQSAACSIIAPPLRIVSTNEVKKTPVNNKSTVIENFNKMNVKEKVHAYEEIILISPGPVQSKRKSSKSESSPTLFTPENKVQTSSTMHTPDTVIPNKQAVTVLSDNNSESESVESVEAETEPVRSAKKDTPRLSMPRRSRQSLRRSLHILPSKQKLTEAETKPLKTRTRLRLKKKQADKEVTTESAESATESASSDVEGGRDSVGSQESCTESGRDVREVDTEAEDREDREERMEVEQDGQANSRRTRSVEKPAVEITAPVPRQSTRTKTRAAQKSVTEVVEQDVQQESAMNEMDGEKQERPRVTRSKMRHPKVQETADAGNDSVFMAPGTPVRASTRTKTRKRQHEDESEGETAQPKRSCTSMSSVTSVTSDDGNHTPTNGDSSDDESPSCPRDKVIRPHPQSFLANLNKTSNNPLRPANLNNMLVKSFIARNSPAPKPTLKEIQEKKKRELEEKQRKEMERMKKREEEHRQKVEEMKKRREEKWKKVQDVREIQLEKEKQSRLELEKRLKEKRQNTLKQREEKMKEEREKQKIRLQKIEEAEERRKQEEAERQKKVQEQLENERFQEELLARKREHEEQERQQKIEEEKRRAAERLAEVEREREKERERLLRLEQEKKKEWQKKKEERDRQLAAEKAEKERIELEKKREKELALKKEMERVKEQERQKLAEEEAAREEQRKRDLEVKKLVEKHNSQVVQQAPPPGKPDTAVTRIPQPNLNRTHSVEEATVNKEGTQNDSYEMTPKRQPQASTTENYCIDDLNSGDETDDEDAPRKKIPDWAQGSALKAQLIKQFYNPPGSLNGLFGSIEAPDLNALFQKKRARFNKRTSSAHWDTPVMKPGLLGRK
ncbi:inner centromere protein-like isoform X1 [Dreissena polymorpha]|uniref:inner centromere protein-like n=1 Tax=Dreissena polymorpha TaxID=45954 RepID=UPI002264E555|nr:inner centromere protein-like [Dreissena polymorpha]XP_052243977.1 inner centromere protein-like isoform X1 [Dreissena polymorpha]